MRDMVFLESDAEMSLDGCDEWKNGFERKVYRNFAWENEGEVIVRCE
jgi:hypothetical protein